MPNGIPRCAEPFEWILRKCCTGCGETKAWAQFAPRAYWPDGTVRVVASRCHKCDSARAAVRAKEWRETHYEEHREYQNAWQRRKRAELRADRAGGGPKIPVGPLATLLNGLLDDGTFESLAVLAEAAGVDERTVRRIFREQARTSLHIADTICTRLGVALGDLYPDDAEEMAA